MVVAPWSTSDFNRSAASRREVCTEESRTNAMTYGTPKGIVNASSAIAAVRRARADWSRPAAAKAVADQMEDDERVEQDVSEHADRRRLRENGQSSSRRQRPENDHDRQDREREQRRDNHPKRGAAQRAGENRPLVAPGFDMLGRGN